MAGKHLDCVLIAGFLFLFLTGTLPSQTNTAELTGRITDSTGAIIEGAHIVTINLERGTQRELYSNEDGYYSCPLLPQGNYRITVELQGFKPSVRTGIRLGVQQVVRVDFILELGEHNEVFEVVDSPSSLNTENAQLSDVRSREDLLNLPINNRSTLAFFTLTSFVYQGDGSGYSLGGLRSTQTDFTIDGTTSNTALWGGQVGPMIETPLESVRELKILSSNNSAEFTRVGTVMIATRAGENQFHGSAFFVSSNNAFNARNTFSPTKPKGPQRHEFGGSIGGPVILPGYDGHNRTFFFFTWEHQKFPGADTLTGNVPTLKMRNGDFSELLPDTPIKDPTTAQDFPGNIIPTNRISSVSQNIQQFGFLEPNYGAPNEFSANWRGLYPVSDHNNRYVVRFDHQLKRSDAISVRVNVRSIVLPNQGDADLETIFQRTQQRQTRNAYVSETRTFSPTLLNEFRFGYARDYSTLAGVHKGAQLIEQFGLQGINTANKQGFAGVPSVNFNNFSSMYEYPSYFWMSEIYEFLDNLTHVKGKHSVKTGLLLRRSRANISECCDGDFGTLNFDGFATGFDYADFLLGLPHSTNRFDRSQPRYNRYMDLGLFVQDDFHVSSKLTLNLGLRYDYFQPPVDKYDMRYGFDPKTGNLVLASDRSKQLVSPIFPSSIPLVKAESAGFPPSSLLESNHADLAPRVGFAYRPFGNNRTVLRAGYGIYYSRLAWTLMNAFAGGPFHSYEDFLNEISNGKTRLQFPNPFPGVGEIGAQSISPVSKELRAPLIQQWNLTAERELPASIVARVTYRGFKTTQIPYNGDINKPFPGGDSGARDFFRYPSFSQVNFVQDGGIQKLQALDLAVERKFTRRLTFQSGWTWAKNLTDVGNDDETGSIENPYNRRREMGNIFWTPRHRFVGQALYELPFRAQKPSESSFPNALRQLLDNWQVSAVAVLQTGQFLTPTFSGSDPSNTRTEGGRPDQIGNPRLADPTISRWFDTSAFALPPTGRFGNSARGVIVGPGLANFDFGLYKHFDVKEKGRLQLRVTATNILNHPNFGNPNVDISSHNAGKITTLQGDRRDTLGGGPRAIQLGLRFDF